MEIKKTDSGLYVPSKNHNMIKDEPMEKLRKYLRRSISEDPQKGKIRANAIYKRVGELVTQSFHKVILPAHLTPTKNMINERLDLCVEIILRCVDQGWMSVRIYDEIERLFWDELIEGKQEVSKRTSWGVQGKSST